MAVCSQIHLSKIDENEFIKLVAAMSCKLSIAPIFRGAFDSEPLHLDRNK